METWAFYCKRPELREGDVVYKDFVDTIVAADFGEAKEKAEAILRSKSLQVGDEVHLCTELRFGAHSKDTIGGYPIEPEATYYWHEIDS